MWASLRTRLTLSHLLVIGVVMGLSGLVLVPLLERYFLRAAEDSLLSQARITAQALMPGSGSPDPTSALPPAASNAIQQRVPNYALEAQNAVTPERAGQAEAGVDWIALSNASLQLSAQLETRIRILDSRGVVRVDSQQADHGLTLLGDPLIARTLTEPYSSRVVGSGRDFRMEVALRVPVGDPMLGVVYLSQPLRDVAVVLRDLRVRWLWATLIAVGLASAVGWGLSGAIARPVRSLTDAAGAVAEGRLDREVPVGSHDELGKLSAAFNEMTCRLRSARQGQVDLVANVSHELRTPLTAIKGLVETLRDGAVDDPAVRDRFLETVEGEADRLTRLVNDLLLLSRADSGVLDLHPEPVDLPDLARRTLDRLERRARVGGITWCVEAEPGVRAGLVDRDRLEQVLVNLLDNAVKFSRPGGRVAVRVKGGGQHTVRVEVQDEGVGIPAEALPRVGQRFYRADRARSRAEGGSGLGLSIARALVEAHGGEVHVQSREGHGTVVTLTLPAA